MDATKFGYAAGARVEWGMIDRLSVKAEYLHVGFGRTFATQTSSTIPTQVFNQSENLNSDIVRLGVNYLEPRRTIFSASSGNGLLQRLCGVPWRVHPDVASSSVVRITGMAFGWMGSVA